MAALKWLLDTSAHRLSVPAVASVLVPRFDSFEIAVCGVTAMELLICVERAGDIESTYRFWTQVVPYIEIRETHVQRALRVQVLMARNNLHRGAKIPDLLVAAVAEERGLTVLHYDDDFDNIARITGQPTEWVVPRASLT